MGELQLVDRGDKVVLEPKWGVTIDEAIVTAINASEIFKGDIFVWFNQSFVEVREGDFVEDVKERESW